MAPLCRSPVYKETTSPFVISSLSKSTLTPVCDFASLTTNSAFLPCFASAAFLVTTTNALTMYASLTTKTSLLTLSYLAVSTTVPFLLSYKETQGNSVYTKGHPSTRSLFNKI